MTTKLFGEMTPQEINMTARNLKRNGEFDEIRTLGTENGASSKEIEDFIQGNTLFLVSQKTVSEGETKEETTKPEETVKQKEVQQQVEETTTSEAPIPKKQYTSAIDKFLDEIRETGKSLKKEEKMMMEAQLAPIIEYVRNADEEFKQLVLQEHKSWKRCYEYMSKEAKKLLIKGNNYVCIEGTTIITWMQEYYKKNDKAQVEKELKKEAEKKKKEAERKKKAAEAKSSNANKPTETKSKADSKKTKKADTKTEPATTEAAKTVKEPATTKQPTNEKTKTAKSLEITQGDKSLVFNLDNQMSIFDMFGNV